jgi:hypothetical protein
MLNLFYYIIIKNSKQGVDVELKELKLMPHGFLSYNFPIWGMREESLEGIRLGTQWFREIFAHCNQNQPNKKGNKTFKKDLNSM